jgi:hypothetical protein
LIRPNPFVVTLASALLAVAAVIAYVTKESESKRAAELSGKELRDSDVKISAFSRHMKIINWNWFNSNRASAGNTQRDSAVYLDTIYFVNPNRSPILWHDTTVVRGQVFIDFMSAPWRLVDQPEYQEHSTNSKLEYEVVIAAPKGEIEPTWLIRQFRYVDTFQPDNGRSQAGLRIPYRADLVSLVLDFTELSAPQLPSDVACRVRRPEVGSPKLVDSACVSATGTFDPAVFTATLTGIAAGSQVILEWSWPK